jgi:NAD(P)-dependent dehydrogenase (short-subunit alcohol dehydrogenase family)
MARSIFITGASSGIGRAVAIRFLDAGWRVGLFARRADRLDDIARGRDLAHVLPGDVSDAEAVETAINRFADTAGRLDVLFNNAGIFTPAAPIDEIPLGDWKRAVDVNLNGMFYAARAAFARMRAQSPQGGRIINNGSISAHAPRDGSITYTTTKHAITGMTKTIALDGRPFDIACGQIDIGNARTDLLQNLIEKAEADGTAPPPSMDVGHVADAVLNMANLPPDANVLFMTVMATKMPFVGRG